MKYDRDREAVVTRKRVAIIGTMTFSVPKQKGARRLAPDRLHMVMKKDSNWRSCGDNRGFSSRAIRDRYPTPQVHNFAQSLQGPRYILRSLACTAKCQTARSVSSNFLS